MMRCMGTSGIHSKGIAKEALMGELGVTLVSAKSNTKRFRAGLFPCRRLYDMKRGIRNLISSRTLMSFAKLEDLGRKLEALEHAQSMLGVDEAVQMPVGGGEKRAEAMAMLAGFYHELAAAPEIAEWIEAAEKEPLDATRNAALRE